MSPVIFYGAIGALLGAGMGMFSYRFVLPWVLEQNENTAGQRGLMVNPAARRRIEWAYRYVGPVCWTAAGALVGIYLGGGL